MERSGSKSIVRFRRARAVLIMVILFWIWLLTGGAGGLTALAGSPNALVLALYAGAVVVPVSALAGLTAGAVMLAEWPRQSGRAAGGARVSKLAQALASARVTLIRLPPWIRRATHARLPALPRISKLPALPRISALPALPRISELPGVKLLRMPVPSRRSASPRPARSATDPMLPSPPPAPKAAPEPTQGPAAPRTSVPARPRRVPAGIPAPPVRLPGQATRIPAPPDCPPGIGTAGNAGNGGSIAS